MWMRILVILAVFVGLFFLGQSRAQDVPDPGKPAPAVAPRSRVGEAAPAAPYDASKRGTENVFELILKGGWVMVPLGLCSVVALASAIDRFLSIRREKIIPPGFIDGLKKAFGPSADVEAGVRHCEQHPSPVGTIFRAGISRLPLGHVAMEKAIEDAGAREAYKLKRSLRPLSLIASISPLLGLLGTVYGLIATFQYSSAMGVGKGDALATGIYEALVTTLAGLVVAIPMLMFYYYFLGKIDRIVQEMNDQSVEFMEHYLGEPAAPWARASGAAG
jgi:biopolymer transport protein ExbB